MPNRNSNSIEIKTECPLEKFMTKTKSGAWTLHFDKLLPLGKRDSIKANSLRWTKRDIYDPDKDEWDIFDTKFGICFLKKEIKDNSWNIKIVDGWYSIVWSFDTAWSPPIRYYNKLLKVIKEYDKNSYIKAYYNEPTNQFFWLWINWKDTTYLYDNIYWCDSLRSYVVTSTWDELDVRTQIKWDDWYKPKDALEDLEELGYGKDNPKQYKQDIDMVKGLIAKQNKYETI